MAWIKHTVMCIRIHASEALIGIVSGTLPAPACQGDDHMKRTGTATTAAMGREAG